MPPIRLEVTHGFYMSPVRLADRRLLLAKESMAQIRAGTSIDSDQSPRTAEPGRATPSVRGRATQFARALWIHWRARRTEHLFVIRDDAGALVGTLGTTPSYGDSTICAELRGWISPEYWRHGIMTRAVAAFTRYAFDELKVLKLTATVFEFNVGAIGALEKNGYVREGHLRKQFLKDGRLIDGYVYGLLKEEFGSRGSAVGSAHVPGASTSAPEL